MLQLPRSYIQFLPLALLVVLPSFLAVSNLTLPIQFEAVAKEANLSAPPPAQGAAEGNIPLDSPAVNNLPILSRAPGVSSHAETPRGEPLRLAEAQGPEPETQSADRLAEAQNDWAEGRILDAFFEASCLAGDLPGFKELSSQDLVLSLAAENLCKTIVVSASDADLDSIEANIDNLVKSTNNPDIRRWIIEFLLRRAERHKAEGDKEAHAACLSRYFKLVRQLAIDYPSSLSAHYAVDSYIKQASELDDKTPMNELELTLETLPVSVVRAKLWVELAEVALSAGDAKQACEYYSRYTSEYEQGAYASLLGDPTVMGSHVKAGRLASLARAYYALGDVEKAKDLYELAADYPVDMSRLSSAHHGPLAARFILAELSARENITSQDLGIAGFTDFVNDYPGSFYEPIALTRIGGLYIEKGDYGAAAEVFGKVVARYPTTEWGVMAQQELTFISEDNPDRSGSTVQNTRVQEETKKVEQLCGGVVLRWTPLVEELASVK